MHIDRYFLYKIYFAFKFLIVQLQFAELYEGFYTKIKIFLQLLQLIFYFIINAYILFLTLGCM